MSKIMAGLISGTRDGVAWPKPGQPIPDDLTDDEVAQGLAAGWIIDRPDVETATAPTRRRAPAA